MLWYKFLAIKLHQNIVIFIERKEHEYRSNCKFALILYVSFISYFYVIYYETRNYRVIPKMDVVEFYIMSQKRNLNNIFWNVS